jgi:hypothetical protein
MYLRVIVRWGRLQALCCREYRQRGTTETVYRIEKNDDADDSGPVRTRILRSFLAPDALRLLPLQ